MSWMKCHDCEQLVNTDADSDCWLEIGNMRRMTEDICVCLSCRDDREREDERQLYEEPEQPCLDDGTGPQGRDET